METARPGQFLSFTLGDLSYGISIGSVREINRVLSITPIPETPAYIAGVMNLRGRVIPIVDLRLRFSLTATPYTRQTCIIVVDSSRGQAGLLVDSIQGVIPLSSDQIEPRPTVGSGNALSFVSGMGKLDKRVLILVEVDRVLTNAPLEILPKAA